MTLICLKKYFPAGLSTKVLNGDDDDDKDSDLVSEGRCDQVDVNCLFLEEESIHQLVHLIRESYRSKPIKTN